MLEHVILISSILIAIIYELNQEGWDKTIYITESKLSIRAWLLFIVSEALFFFTLFWTYIYQIFVRAVWIGFVWPPTDSYIINPLLIPTLNTFILIWSSLEINRTLRDIKTSLIKYTYYKSFINTNIKYFYFNLV
jgi:heme/copper-type cytochrome/quinol oxidase subunit 3